MNEKLKQSLLEAKNTYCEFMIRNTNDFLTNHGFKHRVKEIDLFCEIVLENFEFDEINLIETGVSGNIYYGMFGFFLGALVENFGGRMHSVDIDCDSCRRSEEIFSKELPKLKYKANCQDSVSFLENPPIIPNMVHLDSYDFQLFDPFPSALHTWKEFTKIEKLLPKGAIIFVDDNSTDNSEIILKKIITKYKKFKAILLRGNNRNLSKSVIIGSNKAKGDLIAVMDADLQHRPKDLKKMYLYLKKNKKIDLLIGCRNLNFKNKFRKLSIIRLILSKTLIFFIDTLLGKKTADPMSGFFIFKKNLMNYNRNFYAKGFKILLDIIYSSKKKIIIKDFKIYFQFRHAEHSKISIKVLIHLLLSILKKI